ncbi:MAG: lysozyme [Rhodobacterales bacterium]|nr:MAG: lysozyme [Rhodobacterales bacterium]
MQTSAKGRADLKLHEGEVLKAYLDPVGIWTIGVGLTSASGVIKVKPGMVITREESDRLLSEALKRNYEPRVEKAMTRHLGGAIRKPAQHEFDGGVGFDFNTGAIHRASWVKAWFDQNWVKVEAGLKLWKKGGGKVLPGLVRRRDAEYQLIRFGRYESEKQVAERSKRATAAQITIVLSNAEIAAVRDGFRKLGYEPGESPDHVALSAVTRFQAKHDLTVDGILGRATLSTLQRALDARDKAVPAVGVPAVAGASSYSGADDILTGLPWAGDAVLVAGGLYALWLAWRYRDQIASAIQSPLPRVAAFLRSF